MSDRYDRQVRFPEIGPKGQRRIQKGVVVVVGCGGLGSASAEILARAGVGTIRVIDKDRIAASNLQRQALFADCDQGEYKAIVVHSRLCHINPEVTVKPIIEELTVMNVSDLLGSVGTARTSLVVDGTDNTRTRMLINEFCFRNKIPWVYGAVEGAIGQTRTILPGKTACFCCVQPIAGQHEDVGILASVARIIASYQAVEALKILVGRLDRVNRDLLYVNIWANQEMRLTVPRMKECPCCGLGVKG